MKSYEPGARVEIHGGFNEHPRDAIKAGRSC